MHRNLLVYRSPAAGRMLARPAHAPSVAACLTGRHALWPDVLLCVQVYAYSVAFGRQLGSWAAHDDSVACLQLVTREQLVTASWDCSVKLWRRALLGHADPTHNSHGARR